MAERVQTMPRHRADVGGDRPVARWLVLLPSLSIILLTLALVAGVFYYERSYAGRIHQGVNVLGWNVAGLTPAQAEDFLKSKIRYYADTQLTFRYGDQMWIATPQDLGADLDERAAVAEAYAVGRSGDLRADLWRQLDAYQDGHTVVPRTVFDPAQARAAIEQLAGTINRPARDADIELNGFSATVAPSQIGRSVNVDTAVAAAQDRILHHSEEPIDLQVALIQPAVPDEPVLAAKGRIELLLSNPVTVHYEDRNWTISREMLRDWLVLDKSMLAERLEVGVNISRGEVRSWVAPLAAEIYQLPHDARLDYDPGTGEYQILEMSQDGRTLDIDATVDRILTAVEGAERSAPLAVIVEKPAVDARDVEQMGTLELVSSATTYFRGSPSGRITNIEVAASRFDGVVVPPDGVFSFNEHLGDVSAAEGYEEAYIITGNRTAVGIGGGVCQVSTTVFRAAFFGGFPIEERRAHGYRVGWYETNSIPGLDATIYSPLVDFKFRNDTGAHLLIKTDVDRLAGTITFSFYGRKPDRVVELDGPYVTNESAPKDPVYEVDEDLPPDTIEQIDWAQGGSDVTVYRIIKQDGDEIAREAFHSHYRPWADAYRVSADYPIPEEYRPESTPTPKAGEPDADGEEPSVDGGESSGDSDQ